MHEFLSPLSNTRNDEYGCSLENRQRLLLEIAADIRKIWPCELPVFVRISATDWADNGWNLENTVDTAKKLKNIGIDLIDVSSGGNIFDSKVPENTEFQVPFAKAVKEESGILTSAVGYITSSDSANNIIRTGSSDIIALGRELLRNPYWPLKAAKQLKADILWPNQYLRAKN